ncbi:MAG: nucleotidyltransferase family protein [Oscillospiraceae bacterium]|nr:nucleotidyltransferase family protein [Oscillospiraceae bacterium]MDD3832759.1 nucleotidyltransferase family protein [Oscillospiraceae bacterium]MDD4545948.1 nucleotidyltransferase family protein [Oscillospiraceae bacterium]
MKIAGIVAEYNPFHNGHAYHIEQTRSEDGQGCGATHVVAVMSGNFVQRGQPAIMLKSDRVQVALSGGVDLVLELPLPWAMASAESFAYGAVSILDGLGCVDTLSFGSECGDTALLEKAVDSLESGNFSSLLHVYLDMGISFPEARQRAINEIAGNKIASLFESANNTLGIEYIKSLRRLGSSIKPYTIRRFGAGHDDDLPVGNIASASGIRTIIEAGRPENAAPYLPPYVRGILHNALQNGRCPANIEMIERGVLACLRLKSKEELASLPGISEGLENRLYQAIREAGSFSELIDRMKTKRYTYTRISRIIFAAFLGLTSNTEKLQPPYIRVLGTNERGAEILREAKGAKFPVVSRASRFDSLDEYSKRIFDTECRASDLYSLALPKPMQCGLEFTNKIIKECL